ncbi:hypothetical protein [Saccharopolyspora spinosa]|uniref:Uncharacterized protein n=1 Tax=Saccharopolyspora spinosa TaxID=60894 RepID=A0A2N3Y3V1_SACSN|nr:hypothetical protein [Saccharopolyspora spinosa]PKW17619.1 hypothetical protein A8926_5605 [Saccharopolyspora spinosa]
MTDGEQAYRIEVLDGGDPLRVERLTRSLRDELTRLDAVSVDFAPGGVGTAGSKSSPLADLALLAVGATGGFASSKHFASVLTTAITEWCRKERHRNIRITRGDAELNITGNPDARQQQLAREFLQSIENDA